MAAGGDDLFVYAASVKHDADVRGLVRHPIEGAYISASYDKTARIWCDGECLSTFVGHTGWVVAAAYVPDVNGKPLLATTGWDKNVVLWDVDTCKAEWILDGHAEKASCMAVLKTNELVTGGYDNTIIIWKNAYEVARLTRHKAPVSCVGALQSGEFVSGGAHGCHQIFRWGADGSFKMAYNGHTSGVRGVAAVTPDSFASCSNDTTVVLWDIASGAKKKVFVGHTNQVYAVSALPCGDILSSSEDKTVRVWDQESGECKQSIATACAVFGVLGLDNGDVVAAGTDGNIHRFSRDPTKQATLEDIKAFEEMVASQKIRKGGLGGLDASTLEGPEALDKPGTAEGQQKIIRRGDGAEVYCWNQAKAAWEKIGDVVDGDDDEGAGGGGGPLSTGPKKVQYNGQEYDYVFDVDLTGDGRGYLKLPYNRSENPYEAAQRFIHDNIERGVHQGFLDEIAKFIITNADTGDMNTSAAVSDYAREAAQAGSKTMSSWEALNKMKQQDASGAGGGVAFSDYAKEAQQSGREGGGSVAETMKKLESAPEQVAFSSYAREAQGLAGTDPSVPAGVEGPMVVFDKINAAGMAKKLRQLAGEHAAIPSDGVEKLVTAIQQLDQQDPELTPASYPVAACEAVLTTWPPGARFPVLDFLRQSLLFEPFAAVVLAHATLAAPLRLFAAYTDAPLHGGIAGNEEAGCLKAACNAFATATGRKYMNLHSHAVLPNLSKLWKGGTLPARSALASLLLNYARLYRTALEECHELSASDIVPLLCEGVLFQKEADIINMVLFALGALILPGSAVAHACAERARKCFLPDSLRAIIANEATAATVNRLKDELAHVE